MDVWKSLVKDDCINVFVGDFFDHPYMLRDHDQRVLVAEFDFGDRLIVPEGINVDLEILVFIHKAVAVLADLPLRGVCIHKKTQVFGL